VKRVAARLFPRTCGKKTRGLKIIIIILELLAANKRFLVGIFKPGAGFHGGFFQGLGLLEERYHHLCVGYSRV
jgi:hypothetical protein